MNFIIALCPILLITISIVVLSDLKFDLVLPVTFFLVILVAYVLGLMGLLKWLNLIVLLITLSLMIKAGIQIFRFKLRLKALLQKVITPGFIVYLILVVLTLYSTRGLLFTGWDEFSHWGLVVKNMVSLDTFASGPVSTTMFKDYPPATALLQYYFVNYNSVFIEADIVRAILVFSYSLMIPMVQFTKLKDWIKIPFYSLMFYCLPLIFYFNFQIIIYVDALLGLLYFYLIYIYWSSHKIDFYLILSLSLAGSVLCLVKQSGIVFAFLVWMIIFTDYISTILSKKTKIERTQGFKHSLVIMIPVLASIVTSISWKLYLKLTNAVIMPPIGKITLTGIQSLFTDKILVYQTETISNFKRVFFDPNMFNYRIPLSYFRWPIFLFMIFILGYFFISDKLLKHKIKTIGIGVLLGYFVYTAGLLLLYLFTYTQYEASTLASFSRYMNTYLIGFFFIAFAVGMDILNKQLEKFNWIIRTILFFLSAAMLIKCIFVPFISYKEILPDFKGRAVEYSINFRDDFDDITRYTNNLDSHTNRIYFIAQNTSGYEYWATRYLVTPIPVQPNFSWSLGEKYYEKDQWTKNLSSDQWETELEFNYTYVYLYNIDEAFIDRYGSLFEKRSAITNKSMYRIDKTSSLKLIKLK